jgi:hypothetical protein
VLVAELLDAARLYAGRLGCLAELELIEQLAEDPPEQRQRAAARGERGLSGVVQALSAAFCDWRAVVAGVEAAAAPR